jgi:hypothetical protein
VNEALRFANQRRDRRPEERAHIGRGGRCGLRSGPASTDAKAGPDWSVISPARPLREQNSERFYECLLPGDTKLSKKWAMSKRRDRNKDEWKWPLRQIQYYSKVSGSRYGFLITEKELVVFRFSLEATGDGLGGGRSQRQIPARREATTGTSGSEPQDIVEGIGNVSLVDTDAEHSTFLDPQDLDLHLPEYQLISWGTSGEGKLTVRLALFFLCMLAGEEGGSKIQFDYDPLDSWKKTREGYVHKTTGKKVTARPTTGSIEEEPRPAPAGQSSGNTPRNSSLSRTGANDRNSSATRTASPSQGNPSPRPATPSGGARAGSQSGSPPRQRAGSPAAAAATQRGSQTAHDTRASRATHSGTAAPVSGGAAQGTHVAQAHSAQAPHRSQASQASQGSQAAQAAQAVQGARAAQASQAAQAAQAAQGTRAAQSSQAAQGARAAQTQGTQPRRSARLEGQSQQGQGPSGQGSGSGSGSGGKKRK